MTCFYPISAWQSVSRDSRGKREISFKPPGQGADLKSIQLPCSRCIGCRLERSRNWAVRCMHEASMFERNCFITLTYDAQHLPDDMSLNVRDFQLFMKRLRKRFDGHMEVTSREGVVSRPVRFYHCGEYGEQYGRPHYHACIFNFDFEDKYYFKNSPAGEKLYRSPSLEELWPYGFSSIGAVTFQSAGYVARYIMKKVLGKDADEHYFDPSTGVIKRPEYTTMSRRPGIGYNWFSKYTSDVYPRDFVVVKGQTQRPPMYYDRLIEKFNPEMWSEVKAEREFAGAEYAKRIFVDKVAVPSLDSKRLNLEARLKRFKRSVE